jgi:peptidoglycan-associated lipoprotein
MVENPGPAIPSGPETSITPLPPLEGESGNPLGARPHNLEDYFQDREIFRQDTVYFDFDKYNVKPGELDKVQAVASYLQSQPAEAVLVEGHCDERGTPEYNRALGERRALSVRESLMSLGLDGSRVHTVSFGEDKPADPGHSENAYSKNRRAEFVLLRLKSGVAESR